MMNNQDMQGQMQTLKQLAQQKGISGIAYIDVYPESGFLRIKLKIDSQEQRAETISNFATLLEMMSQGFNLQVNTRVNRGKEDKDG